MIEKKKLGEMDHSVVTRLKPEKVLSPNYSTRKADVDLIVIHYSATGSGVTAKWFQRREAKASSHYVIERDGKLIQCVPLDRVAWHAGRSEFQGRKGCNAFSIGIELENWGPLVRRGNAYFAWPPYDPKTKKKLFQYRIEIPNFATYVVFGREYEFWEYYPPAQIETLTRLLSLLCFRDQEELIPRAHIVGHEHIAPGRKLDPGPAFPWEVIDRMYENLSFSEYDYILDMMRRVEEEGGRE